MIRHTLIVEGSGHFPFDMLRYDSCFPNSQTDVNNLDTVPRGSDLQRQRRVELTHNDTRKRWTPTTGRWESFSWRVLCCEHHG